MDGALALPGQPLDAANRALMEPRFGHDFSQVRVHTDGRAAEAAQVVHALAFTVGQGIYFGAGQYQPGSNEGRQLLAHELAHTIQQQGAGARLQHLSPDGLGAERVSLEDEAAHAAEQVMRGGDATVVGSLRTATPQRQDKDKKAAVPVPKIVDPVGPSPSEQKMIDAARRAAAIRTQTALFKANGVQGLDAWNEARRLAQIKFDWSDPNIEQISEVLRGMGGGLLNVTVKVAGKNDPDCGPRAGYVRGHQPPIILCPGFFKNPADTEGRIRTMIHEMAHVKGVGAAIKPNNTFRSSTALPRGASNPRTRGQTMSIA